VLRLGPSRLLFEHWSRVTPDRASPVSTGDLYRIQLPFQGLPEQGLFPRQPRLQPLIPVSTIPRYRVHNQDMTIGELAAKAAVNIQTVRFYERRGILPEPPPFRLRLSLLRQNGSGNSLLHQAVAGTGLYFAGDLNCFPYIGPSQDCPLLKAAPRNSDRAKCSRWRASHADACNRLSRNCAC